MIVNKNFISIPYEQKSTVVNISESKRKEYLIHFKEVSNGIFACYIPSYDINYTACSFEDIEKVGVVLIESFLYKNINA